MLECVKRQRQTKTEEQGATCKKTICDCMTRQRQTETDKQGAKCKKTDHDYKTKNDRLKWRSKLLNERRLNGTE